MVSQREGLDIAFITFYVPELLVAIFLATHFGFYRSTGWLFLILLGLIRIIGSCCQIVALNQSNPNITLYEIALILNSVGLSPLLGAMLGLLSRVHRTMLDNRGLREETFQVVGVLSTAAVVLAIVGGTKIFSPGTMDEGRKLTKTGILLFVAAWAIQSLLTLYTWRNLRSIPTQGKYFLYAVTFSIPFILVRLVYSILANFDTSDQSYSLLNGNVVVQGLMSVLMEFIVVILYLAAGLAAWRVGK